jgi:hypothetical protein
MIAAGCHGAGIRIGQRYLLIGGGFQLPADRLEFAKAPAQRRQSLGQVMDPGSGRAGVGLLKLGEIARDAFLDMGLAPDVTP